MSKRARILRLTAILGFVSGCGGESPTQPSPAQSFLAGPWRGSVTIERDNQPASSGPTIWTFALEPGTNRQTFRTSIQVNHAWLEITSASTTAITPSPEPPARISTQGTYTSPRGCQASLLSTGQATAARIDATFEGVDCGETFRGSVILTKAQ
jgi:hypothetical protein